MSDLIPGLIVLALILAFFVLMAREARHENAKNDRFVQAMQQAGRRCPDCGGLGWHFGPAGTGLSEVSTPTCSTCNGVGELP